MKCIFYDYISAIHRTHVPIVVREDNQILYIRRKGTLTQNVMAARNFDLLFMFIIVGWRGVVHDTFFFRCYL